MPEQFISESLNPNTATFDTKFMVGGAPGVPREFTWRGETVVVTEVLRVWRSTGPCRHGSGEQYVRKFWYEVKTASHGIMKIYFDKGSRGGKKQMGWRVFSVSKDIKP